VCVFSDVLLLTVLFSLGLLRPSEDREELDKLLHTSDVISMRLFSLEFDSELIMMSACSIWLHSVTRLEYAIDPDLFCV
jgi:hypothetical protein